ncbi:MAG: 2-oxo acid dehydrogenase subunit E2 [Clostridia bacterium]|nr:2-oxo acid dehydrogenase subunit E2 [Clostridia bacterium]
MATPVMMPKVGISVESCILTEWHKKKGDAVKAGEVLFSYETDKSTADEEAPVDGIVLELFAEEGDDIPCMTNVCVIGNEGESVAEFAPAGEAEEEAPAEVKEEVKAEVAAAPVVIKTEAAEGFVKISPRAKEFARKSGVDYRFAVPTGAEGRIIERDIRTLIANGPTATYAAAGDFTGAAGTGIGGKFAVGDIGAAAPAAVAAEPAAEYVDEKMKGVRKAIAKNMALSLSTIPQLTHNSSFDATEVMAFRKKVKAAGEDMGLANITLNDIILFAVSRVLKNEALKGLNAHCIDNGETIRYFNAVNLGVAVDTPRGLLVITVKNADKKSLNEISAEVKRLAKAAQDGSISPDDLQGATFTVSNLGSMGIESFTPVINPPQTGILGVDTIMTRVKEVNGEIKTYPAMGLSLTYDHRVVDGTPASKFLVEMKKALENFSVLLAK